MSRPRCVVVGTGRMAGGFVAPVLADAGWDTVLVGREPEVIESIAAQGEVRVRFGGQGARERRVGGVSAMHHDDPRLREAILGADLLATAVGPGALGPVGRALAQPLRERLEAGRPINLITFENHRRASALIATGLLDAEPSLAGEVGRRLGIGGAAVWRAIASRSVGPDGVRYEADPVDECHVDGLALLDGHPPRDGSVPGLRLTDAFDDRMVEKLWVFNAGHAAAAFAGWLAGAGTVADALARDDIRDHVARVVDEAGFAFAARQRGRGADRLAPRNAADILARYADAALADPVTRVAREPRRKLAADDRLIGPAYACLAAGREPMALAATAAAGLAYAEASDPQARDLQAEVAYFGPEETLTTVAGLHPGEELSRLVCEAFRHDSTPTRRSLAERVEASGA